MAQNTDFSVHQITEARTGLSTLSSDSVVFWGVEPWKQAFWTEFGICLFSLLLAVFEVYDYADRKAKAQGRGDLHTGAHYYWRITCQVFGAIVMIMFEFIFPPALFDHFFAYGAMMLDAAIVYIDREVEQMPQTVAIFEFVLSIMVAFGVSGFGRMTTPVVVIVASLRFAEVQWHSASERLSFKYISAILLAALAWHWFPLAHVARSVAMIAMGLKRDKIADLFFLFDVVMGHLTVLYMFRQLTPEVFLPPLDKDDGIQFVKTTA